jgi:hypothetical protein
MGRVGRGQSRTDLLWTAGAFCVLQLALALYLERGPTRLRDDEFAAKLDRLWSRVAEAPGKPLVVTLGSSRTQMGFDAGSLSRDGSACLAFNLGFDGCGVMMQRIGLRRLLEAGIRPDVAVVEIVPVQLLSNDGSSIEDCWLRGGRFRTDELAALYPYSDAPCRLLGGWLRGRAFPLVEHHAELRAELPLDRQPDGTADGDDTRAIDPWGWKPVRGPLPADRVAVATLKTRGEYCRYVRDGQFAASKLAALRDLLAECRRERIRTAVLLMPEGTAFRSLYPANMDHELTATLQAMRDETGCAAVIDARTWVEDDGFIDSHHLIDAGARTFTERFGREVLPTLLGPREPTCRAASTAEVRPD